MIKKIYQSFAINALFTKEKFSLAIILMDQR